MGKTRPIAGSFFLHPVFLIAVALFIVNNFQFKSTGLCPVIVLASIEERNPKLFEALEARAALSPEEWAAAFVAAIENREDTMAGYMAARKRVTADGLKGDPQGICYALWAGDGALAKRLVEEGQTGTLCNSHHRTQAASPLFVAAEAGRNDIIRQLLEAGAEPYIEIAGRYGPKRDSAVNRACTADRRRTVAYLIDAGLADPENDNCDSSTELSLKSYLADNKYWNELRPAPRKVPRHGAEHGIQSQRLAA